MFWYVFLLDFIFVVVLVRCILIRINAVNENELCIIYFEI